MDRASATIAIEANTLTLRLRVTTFVWVNFKRTKIKFACARITWNSLQCHKLFTSFIDDRMRDIIHLHLHSPCVKIKTPIPDHSALEIERLQMCQMIPDMCNGLLERATWWQVWQDRPSTTQPTWTPHVNRVGLVRIAVDEWTMAGRADCVMPCEEINDVHDELELLLSHNGSKNYGGAKLGV